MITNLIFDWARRTPNKTAVIYNELPWSYRSFAARIALARAQFLLRGYAGSGYAVLAIPNLMDFWILSLALRSLGLTTVAVANAAMLDRLGLPDVRCVITDATERWPDLVSLCAARGWTILSLSPEDEPKLGAGTPEASPEPGGHILLTSGTTGTYKMVLMSPAIDLFLLRRKAEILGMSQDSLMSAFDFAPWTAIGYRCAASAWIRGGTALIEQGREPHRALLYPGLTHGVISPAHLDPILAAPLGAFPRSEVMQLLVGGGAMTRFQVEQAKARITPRLFNSLASTEASIVACTLLETEEDHRWHRVIPDRAVEIVDDSDRPVPTGQVGRVRVSTTGGPTGYLDNDAATNIFFKKSYFYPGDLAVTRSDGRIALQGRSTDVINLRGHKIFPGPIEDRLSEVLDVTGVCLLSIQNESGEEVICVAVETSTPIESERLHAALKKELNGVSDARVQYCESLPRNQMGKVLRQAVRAQVTTASSSLA